MHMTTRRNFYLWLSTAALPAPPTFAAESPPKIWRIGFLALGHIDYVESSNYYGGFRQGMGERGYVEGQKWSDKSEQRDKWKLSLY